MTASMKIFTLILGALIFISGNLFADDFYTSEEIQSAVINFLKSQSNQKGSQSIQYKTGHIDASMRLARCSIPPSISIASSNTVNQHALVQVRCEGARPWRIYIPIQTVESGRYVVASSSLPSGTVLSESDLELTEQPFSGQKMGVFQSTAPLIGKVLKRSVALGKPILSSMIEVPLVVKKGETVTMVVEKGNLQVAMSGIALQDGVLDKEIQVRNKRSNKIVEGRVVSRGVVKII